MTILYIFTVLTIFLFGYLFFGKILEKMFNISETEEVPAKKLFDRVDFVPTNKFVLLGHHFSSIAGAGPILGPIIASVSFGWVPTVIWILLGTIFIGGVHDFTSLVFSIRHEGRSIAEIANKYINKSTYKIFLIFIWLALMYVVTVFTDIAAENFFRDVKVVQISFGYVIIAIIFGIMIYKLKLNLVIGTILTLILISGFLYYTFTSPPWNINFTKHTWIIALLIYAFTASILPVWLLLQPRDYISSFILYISVIIGLVGTIFGNFKISYPMVKSFYSPQIGPMVPFLFITVACGAISGFHSLVSSGTTSKQIDNMKNARFVGYGGMILEGIVACIALSTVMILSTQNINLPPNEIYATGIAKYLSLLKIPENIGKTFGFLIISVFVLTTLDSATRISRYIFQEIIELRKNIFLVRFFSTFVSLILPIILLNVKIYDAKGNLLPVWRIVWPLFGTTNQLLAALVLTTIYLWTRKSKFVKNKIVFIPAVFMIFMTLSSLCIIIFDRIKLKQINVVLFIAIGILILTIFVIKEIAKTLKNKTSAILL